MWPFPLLQFGIRLSVLVHGDRHLRIQLLKVLGEYVVPLGQSRSNRPVDFTDLSPRQRLRLLRCEYPLLISGK